MPLNGPPFYGATGTVLFAAGEYLGSAAALAKAIELDARVALAKADLIEIVGGPDRFVQRSTDLEQRAAQPGSPAALQLLLAYVYQQMDQPEAAQTALQAAKKGLPSPKAVTLLEAALNTRGG